MGRSFKPETVFITGASKGIGRTIALLLASKGFSVIGTTRSPIEGLRKVENEFKGKPVSFSLLSLDVTKPETISQATSLVLETFSHLDVLINNAGYGLAGPLYETTMDDLYNQFETNFFGVHRVTRAFLPHFLNRRQGKIITIGSVGGRLGLPCQGAYSASKAAIAMYSDTLRMELKQFGIQVSLIEPGDTRSEFDKGRKYVHEYSHSPYCERAINIMRTSEHNGTDPMKVAKTVHKIIRAKHPKGRYLVGSDAQLVNYALRFLPHKWAEVFIMKNYKIPSKPRK